MEPWLGREGEVGRDPSTGPLFKGKCLKLTKCGQTLTCVDHICVETFRVVILSQR